MSRSEVSTHQYSDRVASRLTFIENCINLTVIGISIPAFAQVVSQPASLIPSATSFIPSGSRPVFALPSSSPTNDLQASSAGQYQVSRQAGPSTFDCAPDSTLNAKPASPRVISAAILFEPYPSPAVIPAAIAITFFTEPPNSVPPHRCLVNAEVLKTRQRLLSAPTVASLQLLPG